MNQRLPVIASFLAVVAVSASAAYWGLQLFKPAQRPIAAVPVQGPPELSIAAAKGLFGGDTAVAAPSNYQLRGVVAAANGRGSVAIIVADGKPAKAYPVGAELAPGVKVTEVQARHVMLSEGGAPKRLDLMVEAQSGGGVAAPLAPTMPQMQPPTPQPIPQPIPPAAPTPQPAQPVPPPRMTGSPVTASPQQ